MLSINIATETTKNIVIAYSRRNSFNEFEETDLLIKSVGKPAVPMDDKSVTVARVNWLPPKMANPNTQVHVSEINNEPIFVRNEFVDIWTEDLFTNKIT